MDLPHQNRASNVSHQLVEHLFRHGASRLTAHLTRRLGLDRIDLVEDVVQEALLRAMRSWPHAGVPENPEAWLFRAAGNAAIDLIRREKALVARLDELAAEWTNLDYQVNEPVFETELQDDQLRMLFACCHPSLSREAQVAIALRELCGFSTNEIARAFVIDDAIIAQRIVRGKKRFRSGKVSFEVPPPSEIPARLDAVLQVIYLIFNEAYNRHSGTDLVCSDMAFEAMRLAEQLIGCPAANCPKVHALLALFYFQASRFPARISPEGEMLLLEDQDRTLWDRKLIAKGFAQLDQAVCGQELSRFHLEAMIASVHATASDFRSTNWVLLAEFYDQLVELDSSPIVRLNRAIALGRCQGSAAALAILQETALASSLEFYHLYHATLAEFRAACGDSDGAIQAYLRALHLAGNEPERRLLKRKLSQLRSHD